MATCLLYKHSILDLILLHYPLILHKANFFEVLYKVLLLTQILVNRKERI